MKVAITDTNIFIDIIELDLIEFLFQIGLEIHSTIGIIEELNEAQQKTIQQYITNGQLNIHFQTEGQLLEIEKMEFDRGFSDVDCFLLFLSKSNRIILLSGERKMRLFCKENDLEIRGIIWLFDEFFRMNLITAKTAILKMEKLILINPWLPLKICRERIALWKKAI